MKRDRALPSQVSGEGQLELVRRLGCPRQVARKSGGRGGDHLDGRQVRCHEPLDRAAHRGMIGSNAALRQAAGVGERSATVAQLPAAAQQGGADVARSLGVDRVGHNT